MPTSSAYEWPETTLGTVSPPREGREKRDKVQKGIRLPTFQQGPQNGNVDVLVLLGADVKHRYLFAMKPDNTYSQVPTGILHIFRGCLICDIVVYQSKLRSAELLGSIWLSPFPTIFRFPCCQDGFEPKHEMDKRTSFLLFMHSISVWNRWLASLWLKLKVFLMVAMMSASTPSGSRLWENYGQMHLLLARHV